MIIFDNKARYINACSNDPLAVLREIQNLFLGELQQNHLIKALSTKQPHSSTISYENVDCGCKEDIKNQPQESSLATRSKNRPRIIIWYNQPCSKNVKTNVREAFFK